MSIIKTSAGPIIDVQFFGSPFHAVIARGPLLRPTFATVSFKTPKDENDSILKEVLIEELQPVRTMTAKESKSSIPRNLNENVLAVSDFPLPGYDATVEKNHKRSRKRSLNVEVRKENGASMQSESREKEPQTKRARLEGEGIGNGATLVDALVSKKGAEDANSIKVERGKEVTSSEGIDVEDATELPSRARSVTQS